MNSMLFLAKFSFGDLVGDLKLIVVGMIRQLFYTICSAVYMMITYVYNIFIMLCNGQLLRPSEINELFSRVGVLLGIIMILRVILSFIQSLVDPNSAFDGKKGIPGVVKKVVIVIVMFGVSSYIFSVAREIQVLVIDKEVIPNLILPVKVDTTNFGGALSANLFTAFYNLNSDLKEPENKDEFDLVNSTNCGEEYIKNLQKSIANNNDFSYMDDICVAETVVYKSKLGDGSSTKDFVIDFNFIFCLLVGVMVLWYLLNYCIQVGMRIIQLTMLQVISPMAFISYLSPKDENMFSKWLKLYTSTYIDVFIRIAVIDFVCYLSALIMTEWNSGKFSTGSEGVFWTSVNDPSGMVRTITGIIMIIALFTFAKKAPELIKTLFPTGAAGSAIGFGTSDTKGGIGAAGAAAIGGVAGGISSGFSRAITNRNQGKSKLTGFASGFVMGTGRGALTAGKNKNLIKGFGAAMNANRDADNKYDELVAEGGSSLGVLGARVMDQFGVARGSLNAREVSRNKKVEEANKEIQDIAEGFKEVKTAKNKWETARMNGAGERELDRLWKDYKTKRKGAINSSFADPNNFDDPEERALASQIKSKQTGIQQFYETNNMSLKVVKRDANGNLEYDNNGKVKMQELTSDMLVNATIFEDASSAASIYTTEIMSKRGAGAAAANAKAAGAVGKKSGGNN